MKRRRTGMKRLGVAIGTIGLGGALGVIGLGGVAGAAAGGLFSGAQRTSHAERPAIAAAGVTRGSQWTLFINGGGCEVLQFGKRHLFTEVGADTYGDSGTYAKGPHRSLTILWTAGADYPSGATGAYQKSPPQYNLTFNGIGAGFTGYLQSGDLDGC